MYFCIIAQKIKFVKQNEVKLIDKSKNYQYNIVVPCESTPWSADVAQQVERVLGKDEVTGSSPVISSIKQKTRMSSACFLFYCKLYIH